MPPQIKVKTAMNSTSSGEKGNKNVQFNTQNAWTEREARRNSVEDNGPMTDEQKTMFTTLSEMLPFLNEDQFKQEFRELKRNNLAFTNDDIAQRIIEKLLPDQNRSDSPFGPVNRPATPGSTNSVIPLHNTPTGSRDVGVGNDSGADQDSDLQRALRESMKPSGTSNEDTELNRTLELSMAEEKQRRMANHSFDEYAAQNVEEVARRKSLVGVNNLGNSCWFSAISQIFFHIPEARNVIMNMLPKEAKSPDDKDAGYYAVHGAIREQFAMMQGGPYAFVDANATVKALDALHAGESITTHQQDGVEMFMRLLNALEHATMRESNEGHATRSTQEVTDKERDALMSDIYKYGKPPGISTPPARIGDSLKRRKTNSPRVSISESAIDASTLQQSPLARIFSGQLREFKHENGTWKSGPSTISTYSFSVDPSYGELHDALEAQFINADNETWMEESSPALFVSLSRYSWDNQTCKKHDRMEFPEELYIDRYLSKNRDVVNDDRNVRDAMRMDVKGLKGEVEGLSRFQLNGTSISPDALIDSVAALCSGEISYNGQFVDITMLDMQKKEREGRAHWKDRPTPTPAFSQNNRPMMDLAKKLRECAADVRKRRKEKEKEVHNSEIELVANDPFEKDSLKNCGYDLFAILVHKGRQATSGHYYSFIKNEHEGTWLRCDDRRVTDETWENIQDEAFGGENKQERSAYGLLYLKRTAVTQLFLYEEQLKNGLVSPIDSLPEDLKTIVNHKTEEFERHQQAKNNETRALSTLREEVENMEGGTEMEGPHGNTGNDSEFVELMDTNSGGMDLEGGGGGKRMKGDDWVNGVSEENATGWPAPPSRNLMPSHVCQPTPFSQVFSEDEQWQAVLFVDLNSPEFNKTLSAGIPSIDMDNLLRKYGEFLFLSTGHTDEEFCVYREREMMDVLRDVVDERKEYNSEKEAVIHLYDIIIQTMALYAENYPVGKQFLKNALVYSLSSPVLSGAAFARMIIKAIASCKQEDSVFPSKILRHVASRVLSARSSEAPLVDKIEALSHRRYEMTLHLNIYYDQIINILHPIHKNPKVDWSDYCLRRFGVIKEDQMSLQTNEWYDRITKAAIYVISSYKILQEDTRTQNSLVHDDNNIAGVVLFSYIVSIRCLLKLSVSFDAEKIDCPVAPMFVQFRILSYFIGLMEGYEMGREVLNLLDEVLSRIRLKMYEVGEKCEDAVAAIDIVLGRRQLSSQTEDNLRSLYDPVPLNRDTARVIINERSQNWDVFLPWRTDNSQTAIRFLSQMIDQLEKWTDSFFV